MPLIEVTLVIAILLSLTSVLFFGATAYKKGSDRAICIQNIASVKKAVRSYGGDFLPAGSTLYLNCDINFHEPKHTSGG